MTTVQQLLSKIASVNELSFQNTQTAERITISNFFTTAPQLINGLRDLITMLSDDNTEENKEASIKDTSNSGDQEYPPYSEASQEALASSFREFVNVHQNLLSTIIGKHGPLAATPFCQPLSQELRVLEGGIDTFAFGLIDAVPAYADDATGKKESLDETLQNAVDTYE